MVDIDKTSGTASQLYYQRMGSGPALLLLHGLFGQGDNLMPIAKVLAAHFDVIVPDMLNHGRSYHSANMNYISMAQAVAKLLDDLDIKQCHIVGHSMGGKVAMQLASMQPELLQRLVVVDIAPVDYPMLHQPIIAAMQKVAEKNQQALAANQPQLSRRDAQEILARGEPVEAVQQFLLKSYKKNSEGHWQWLFALKEIAASYRGLAKAPKLINVVTSETLFIKGEQSNYIQAESQGDIARYFTQPQFKIVQGAGHWLHSEKPQAFLRLLERFLAH